MAKRPKMKPEERVNLAIDMSNVVARICIDAIRDQHPTASNEEIILEARRRIMHGRAAHRGV